MDAYRLRAWLEKPLSDYGQWLQRTPEGSPEFSKLGRWSRWDKHGLLEAAVDLADLAARVRTKLNTPEPRAIPKITDRNLRSKGGWVSSQL